MSILIKDIEMPKDGKMLVLCVGYNGKVLYPIGFATEDFLFMETGKTAIELQPHGRLIDADKLVQHVKGQVELVRQWGIEEMTAIAEKLEEGILAEIDLAPTIIEAEGEDNDD